MSVKINDDQTQREVRRERARLEARLAERLVNRETGAMDELYSRYGRLIFTVILRLVWDNATAEDLTQEAFLRIWNGIRGFDPERGSLAVWVAAVARNRALDYMGSVSGRMARAHLESKAAQRIAVHENFEERILDKDQVRRLQPAIDRLPREQRIALDLCYQEGLSHNEIAVRMNRPLGTVKTWVRNALQAIREHARDGLCEQRV
jgi:RNA polymerase sigma-70 factor (ECF subfamily)